MRLIFTLSFILVSYFGMSQNISLIKEMKPEKEYSNIYVKKISDDSLQTSFLIWVKKSVKNHYHAEHTENIYVLAGKAKMTIADSVLRIRKGDFLSIPKGVHHSVTKVFGRTPLKVLSIQAPKFTGADRVFVDE